MIDFVLHCLKHNNYKTSELNQGDIIDELDYFSFYLESSSECDDLVLLITDIPIKITKLFQLENKFYYGLDSISISKYFLREDFKISDYEKEFYVEDLGQKIYFYRLFLNYPIGLCDISLFNDITENILESFKIHVVSAKINAVEFASLVSYVESKGTAIWAKHSLLKHTATGNILEDKTEWIITSCEFFLDELIKKYLYLFNLDKITILKQNHKILEYSSDINISEDSLFWLVNNLNVLQPTISSDVNKIAIRSKLFSPLEILASEFIESTDTNENQIIHGFINELRRYLLNIKTVFEIELEKCSRITFEGLISFYSYTRNINRLNSLIQYLSEIKHFLETHIPVTTESIDNLNTNKISAKTHYAYVYSYLMEWLNYRDATFSKEKQLFKGINRMDKLFERACFYKLIDSFTNIGYDAHIVDYDFKKSFPKKIKLSQKGIIHYLYVENLPDKLYVVRGKTAVLEPDFIIELENGSFIILDAKYKKIRNVSEFDYPDLSLKYLHGIGLKKGGFFNPIALLVLFPDKNSLDFYHKKEYDLFSRSPVFPSIGSIGINFEEKSKLLNSSIEQLLKIRL